MVLDRIVRNWYIKGQWDLRLSSCSRRWIDRRTGKPAILEGVIMRSILYLIVTIMCVLVYRSDAVPPTRDGGSPAKASPSVSDYSKYVNANRLLSFVSNRGHLFYDAENMFGRYDGLYYPHTSVDDILSGLNEKTVVYDAGLWMGGIVVNDTLVSVAEYSTEYVPGNMIAGSFDPDFNDPKYRVYKLFCDSMGENPNSDYLGWPTSQGAPIDDSGKPLALGCQTTWCCYNDANAGEHTNAAGGTAPLGIEVRQTVWASENTADSEKVFVRYQFFNRGTKQIAAFYVSFWADADIGGAGDDLVGCDTLNDIFYSFNGDNSDAVYGSFPPAWGGRILASPVVPSPGDSAIYFGKYRHGYRNVGLTAFAKYINGTDPSSAAQSYSYMVGLERDGSPRVYNGQAIRFACSGNPIMTEGDLDANPSDRRVMASCGPINFNPGDSEEMVIVFACGRGMDRLQSLSLLLTALSDAQVPTGVPLSEPVSLPADIGLRQNYPNPFNGSTVFEYYLSSPQVVRLEVFNPLGERVRTLVNEFKSVGVYHILWDGLNERGNHVASGVYQVRLKSSREQRTIKAVLLN